MIDTCTVDGVAVEGVPPRLALYPYGGFTTCVAINGGVRGWARHEERLARAALALWGHELDVEAVRGHLRAHLARTTHPCVSVRVTLFPAEFALVTPESASGCTVLITSAPADPLVQVEDDFEVQTVEYTRPLAEFKSTDLFSQIGLRRRARTAGYDDALLVAGHKVLEGVTWSVVLWRGGRALTPAGAILPSITVSLIEEVARGLGYEFSHGEVLKEELREADLVLAVSVNHPARAVSRVDDHDLRVDRDLLAAVAKAYEALPLDRL